jgi:protein phosphatase
MILRVPHSMARLEIPRGVPLRVVGDVHGDAKGFAAAAATERFVIQLGDLVDDGPDTPEALRIMFGLIDRGQGLFLLGNHDFKLARALRGDRIQGSPALRDTIGALDATMRSRFTDEARRAPGWIAAGRLFFVHGGFHLGMLNEAPPGFPAGRADALLARALYGQPTGRVTGGGKPERSLAWVNSIPDGMTVYCGHDRRSTDGRPLTLHGKAGHGKAGHGTAGGMAVFLDTGAGKGGHLSWIDLPALS